MINNTDLDAFGYYDQNHEKELAQVMTPADMLKVYHNQAELPSGVAYNKMLEDDLSNLRLKLISEESHEVFDAVNNADEPEEVLKELADLVYVTFGMAETYGWDLMEALRRVHHNNMERMYQDDGTIKRREDGKILKNPNTPKVNLEDLV